MGANESSMAHTEGQLDGRPYTFYYKRGQEGTEEETKLGWAEGYKIYPNSKWTQIPAKSILAMAPTRGNPENYHFLYVEGNPSAQRHKGVSPVVFKSHIITNPPGALAHDLALPRGEACWEFRQDPAKIRPNFHVIVSTGSGTGQAKSVWEHLVKPALSYCEIEQDKTYELHFTTSETSIADLTQEVFLPQANLGVLQSIILLSGDGGIVDIINTLLSGERGRNYRKPNITILPLGTGNALAHSAGVTADNTLGVKSWIRGEPTEIPLFAATFSSGARVLFDEARQERPLHLFNGKPTAHGAVVCSWGFHAGLVADSDTVEFRKFGAERFKMAAKEALFPSDGSPPHAYRGNVSVMRHGGQNWETLGNGEHAYVLATLVSDLEKGFKISPASKPLDGKLRLVHFDPVSGEAAMEIMTKAYQGGQHVDDERVDYEEVDALRIKFNESDPRWRRVCIDGKIIRVEENGWVEVKVGQKGVVDVVVER